MNKSKAHDVLGVSASATDDEIKKAYRKLAMKYHPDRNQGDKDSEEKFKEVQSAYDVLTGKSQPEMDQPRGWSNARSMTTVFQTGVTVTIKELLDGAKKTITVKELGDREITIQLESGMFSGQVVHEEEILLRAGSTASCGETL